MSYYYKRDLRGEIEEVYAFDPQSMFTISSSNNRIIAVFGPEELANSEVLRITALTKPFSMPVQNPKLLENWRLVHRGNNVWKWEIEYYPSNLIPK